MQPATSQGEPVPGQVFQGKYLVTERLGEGGMGVVFAAHNGPTEAGFPCAIKWLKPAAVADRDSVARFLREADVAGYIKSDFVVKVFDKHDDPAYIVMERLVGESLRQYLDRLGRPLRLDEVMPIMGPVLRAVRAAHRTQLPHGMGVLHRDLKPENLFLDRQVEGAPTPKVLDFGIAKLLEPDGNITMETTELIRGTPSYMAREQLFEPEAVGPWTDVHALGVILYEMLAGRRPFEGQTTFDVCLNVREGVYTPLNEAVSGLPEGLAAVVERAFLPDQSQRYQSVADLEIALHPYMGAAPGSSVPLPSRPELHTGALPSTPPPPERASAAGRGRAASVPPPVAAALDDDQVVPARGSRSGWMLLAVVLLMGGALATWVVWPGGGAAPEPAAAGPEPAVEPPSGEPGATEQALPADSSPVVTVAPPELPDPSEMAPSDPPAVAPEEVPAASESPFVQAQRERDEARRAARAAAARRERAAERASRRPRERTPGRPTATASSSESSRARAETAEPVVPPAPEEPPAKKQPPPASVAPPRTGLLDPNQF